MADDPENVSDGVRWMRKQVADDLPARLEAEMEDWGDDQFKADVLAAAARLRELEAALDRTNKAYAYELDRGVQMRAAGDALAAAARLRIDNPPKGTLPLDDALDRWEQTR